MCFQNDKRNLDQFRKGKRAITVWKTGNIDDKTGLVITGCRGQSAVWKKGEVVRPHEIRKPLRDGAYCSAGLYFYTTTLPKGKRYQHESVVVARVNPQDIIAVSDYGIICCVAAKVTRAPNPDPKLMRIKCLKKGVREATAMLYQRAQSLKQWEEQQEDKEEILQNMRDELEKLQPKKGKTKRNKK